MSERDLQSLLDMLVSAKLANGYVAGKTWAEFEEDIKFQDAVIRRLEIIGEAAGRISQETRRSLPQFSWGEIIGMRNKIVHEYDGVRLDIVWATVREDLPALIAELEKIVSPEDPNFPK